ncbi:hypothetical protein [Undibacterium sp. Ren11W]|uniref:hypothetical protein n=1 Tax=Undibacterium sp. Ren11W TaxID=3413045 RepID=UPI003BF318EE
MHITTLRTGQVWNSYVVAGSKIHLTAGAISLSEAPIWGDAHGFFHETVLQEGATYQVQRSGWLLIKASKNTEFLAESPEPASWRRLFVASKRSFQRLFSLTAKKFLHHKAL